MGNTVPTYLLPKLQCDSYCADFCEAASHSAQRCTDMKNSLMTCSEARLSAVPVVTQPGAAERRYVASFVQTVWMGQKFPVKKSVAASVADVCCVRLHHGAEGVHRATSFVWASTGRFCRSPFAQ